MSGTNLSNIKAGDIVVREIHGASHVTECLTSIEYVNTDTIFIQGADEDYSKDSVYSYSRQSGFSNNNYIPGFFARITRKATKEDIKNLTE